VCVLISQSRRSTAPGMSAAAGLIDPVLRRASCVDLIFAASYRMTS